MMYPDRPVFVHHRLRPYKTLSDEKVPETFDEALDFTAKTLKASAEGLTYKNIAETYLKSKVRVAVVFRSLAGGVPSEYLALFERALEGVLIGLGASTAVDRDFFEFGKRDDSQSICCSDRWDKAMLVHNVEIVEPTEQFVPSLVWLLSFDEVERLWAGSLYESCKFGFKDLPELPRKDRELCLFRNHSAIGENQLTSEMVKTGAEIVDRVCQDQRDPLRGLLENPKFHDSVASLRIVISNTAITLAFREGAEFDFEVADVLFGPFDLCLD